MKLSDDAPPWFASTRSGSVLTLIYPLEAEVSLGSRFDPALFALLDRDLELAVRKPDRAERTSSDQPATPGEFHRSFRRPRSIRIDDGDRRLAPAIPIQRRPALAPRLSWMVCPSQTVPHSSPSSNLMVVRREGAIDGQEVQQV
jgi:hypothetical protein